MRPGGAALVCVMLLCLTTPFPSSGDEAHLYTTDQCVRRALEYAVPLANAHRDLEAANARIVGARSEAFPQLALKADYTRFDEVASFDFGDGRQVSFGQLNNYSAGLEVTQLLYSGGRIGAGIRAAGLYRRYAALSVERAARETRRDVVVACADLLLARKAVEVFARSVEHLEQFATREQARFEAQTASEFDLLSARVRAANEKPKWIEARNRLELARERLRTLAHLPPGPFDLAEDLSYAPADWSLDELLTHAVTRRPELIQMDLLAGLREQELQSVRSEQQPTANAFFSYTGANSSQNNPAQSEWDWRWTAGATVRWTFFDGGQRASRITEKRLEAAKARALAEDFRRAVTMEIRQAYLDMVHARESVAGGEEIVVLAQRSLSIAETRHQQGLATALEYAEANLALRTAQLALQTAVRDHLAAVERLRCAAALGDPPLEHMEAD